MLLSEQAYKKIDREVAKFPADQKQSAVMAALAIAQDETRWLMPEVMQEVVPHHTGRQIQDLCLHQSALCLVRRREGSALPET